MSKEEKETLMDLISGKNEKSKQYFRTHNITHPSQREALLQELEMVKPSDPERVKWNEINEKAKRKETLTDEETRIWLAGKPKESKPTEDKKPEPTDYIKQLEEKYRKSGQLKGHEKYPKFQPVENIVPKESSPSVPKPKEKKPKTEAPKESKPREFLSEEQIKDILSKLQTQKEKEQTKTEEKPKKKVKERPKGERWRIPPKMVQSLEGDDSWKKKAMMQMSANLLRLNIIKANILKTTGERGDHNQSIGQLQPRKDLYKPDTTVARTKKIKKLI